MYDTTVDRIGNRDRISIVTRSSSRASKQAMRKALIRTHAGTRRQWMENGRTAIGWALFSKDWDENMGEPGSLVMAALAPVEFRARPGPV